MQDILTSGASTVFVLLKIGFLVFLFIYVIFAGVIIKQVRMMTDTLDLGLETQIKLIVLIHFLISLVILVLAFFLL
jgi:hypothetical protein